MHPKSPTVPCQPERSQLPCCRRRLSKVRAFVPTDRGIKAGFIDSETTESWSSPLAQHLAQHSQKRQAHHPSQTGVKTERKAFGIRPVTTFKIAKTVKTTYSRNAIEAISEISPWFCSHVEIHRSAYRCIPKHKSPINLAENQEPCCRVELLPCQKHS